MKNASTVSVSRTRGKRERNADSFKVHPLAQAIPEMLRDEYVDLVRDIKSNGLKQPIVMFEGMILDGRHRARACAELKVAPTTIEFTGTTDEAKRFVISINVHRRHLTLGQKQQIVDAELKRDPTQSDRAIAKKASVDHKTVAKARSKAKANGEIPHKGERVEASGRKARGRKPITVDAVLVGVMPPPTPLLPAPPVFAPERFPTFAEVGGEMGVSRLAQQYLKKMVKDASTLALDQQRVLGKKIIDHARTVFHLGGLDIDPTTYAATTSEVRQ